MDATPDPTAFFRAVLAASSAPRTLDRAVAILPDGIGIGGRSWRWRDLRTVSIAGLGKAAAAQCAHLARVVDAARPAEVARRPGVVVVPAGSRGAVDGAPGLEWVCGSHPVCDESSRRAAERLLGWFADRRPDELVLFCLTGGGSALAELPRPPFTFAEQRALFEALLARGAPIDAANLLRRELSAIKNGGLRAASATRRIVTLVTSDVPHDDLALVASGPTLHRPLELDAIRRAATRWLPNALAERIVAQLDGDERAAWNRRLAAAGDAAEHGVRVADWRTAVEAAREALPGWTARLPDAPADAPIDAGLPDCLDRLRAAVDDGERPPLAILAAGEWTVPVDGAGPGSRGGRASEFVCRAAQALFVDRRPAFPTAVRDALVVASLATDGRDGNSEAAGGWLDAATVARAAAAGIELGDHLRRHDTAGYLARCGTAFAPGPTDTNLMDVHALLWRAGSTGQSEVKAT